MKQTVVDRCVDDIAYTLNVPRAKLNVVSLFGIGYLRRRFILIITAR